MIISFKNINGGGGGGYVLPTATANRLGGVMIGEGINVDSAGTISVTGGTIEEMPISPFMSKDLNANGRCFSKEVEFTFFVSRDLNNNGQPFNSYKFNPYLNIKQLNGSNWNKSSYLDIYITKGEQDEYPTFKLVNGYNIGQGFVSEKLIEETLDFNIGIEGEYNQVEFDIRDFLLRADNRYGSQDYTVKGLKVEIINDGTGNGYLKFKMDSDDNQTFLNYLMLPNDAYDYNVNIDQTFANTQGHYPIATNSNVGMVQIGSGFTYSDNNGSLSVPTASKNQTGIVRIGDGLNIENGVLSDKDDVKAVSELPTTSITETIGSIWHNGQEQTGDFTYRTSDEIGFRKGNTNPQENITLFKIESYQKYTTLEMTPDGTYIVTDESGTEHYLNFEGDFLEISGTMVTYTFSYNYEGAADTLTITLSEDKEIEDVYVDTPVTKVLAVGDEGDIVAMVDASENLCFYEIVNQEWSEKYAHCSGGGGGGIEVVDELPASGTDGQVVILVDSATSSTTEYIWTDNAKLVADIDYVDSTNSTEKVWCVSYKSEYFPIGNAILVTKYQYGGPIYFHYVVENDGLYCYASSSDTTYDGTVYYKPEKYKITRRYMNTANSPFCYYGDECIVIFTKNDSYMLITTRDFSYFYRSGWIKNKHHSIRNTAFYADFTFYDEDFNILTSDYVNYPLNNTKFKINPTSQYSTPKYVYSISGDDIGPFFAPTTTGQTGYVCVAGNGWAAPTWKNPSTLLNKSTLYGTHSTFIVAPDDWKLLDSSSNNTFGAGNFYIYNTCDYNVTTEIVDFNDSTDNGEGGMTDPTKELKVSANTDGSYDVFYGEFMDYQGGLYSYTASTHLDTVFTNYEILSEDQTGIIVRIVLRPDGLYCYENNSGCGFVNNSYSTFGVGDSVTIGKMTVFANYEDTPTVFLSQPEE